ncbi:hypothetical protein NE236_29710 [Actinoallomurus purpureus]|uniref:hypothetical protein n=1 Tax=Actinoallomurus purpureus TaxID=478114 RepID=UPI0020939B9D|nr:hypothetical protein [Actinoallomurus purpureus]MCO6009154.1 hypothetical protein [Actinoallomurus purpureus]
MTVRPRAVAVEAAIIVLLGLILAAMSLGLFRFEYGGGLHLGAADLLTAAAAGIAAASAVRTAVRLHRRWKKTVGRFTAAATLCAAAAIVGMLVVMIPSACPGELGTSRCSTRQAATWGEAAGLATLVNFMVAGLLLAVMRGTRDLVSDGTAQGVTWVKALSGTLRRRFGGPSPDRARGSKESGGRRHPQQPKGRPTPRRADAERTRRKRSRGA